jgi:hypothetical protein
MELHHRYGEPSKKTVTKSASTQGGIAPGRESPLRGGFLFLFPLLAEPEFLQFPFEGSPIFPILAALLPFFGLQRFAHIVKPR